MLDCFGDLKCKSVVLILLKLFHKSPATEPSKRDPKQQCQHHGCVVGLIVVLSVLESLSELWVSHMVPKEHQNISGRDNQEGYGGSDGLP